MGVGGVQINWKKGLAIGAAAGLVNGLFGTGGGMLVVPLLIGWAKMPSRTAFATSLAIILPLSVVSLGFKLWQTGAPLAHFATYLIGGIVGGVLAGRLLQKLPTLWLHRLFGALILLGGLRAVMGW